MLTAKDRGNITRIAWRTEKDEAPFYCAGCKEELILRKGDIRSHHFAHKGDTTEHACTYAGESPEHLEAKREIFEAIEKSPWSRNVGLEKQIGKRRADVAFEYCERDRSYWWQGVYQAKTKLVAIEIMRAGVNDKDIERKTLDYANAGAYVLWLALPGAAAGWRKAIGESIIGLYSHTSGALVRECFGADSTASKLHLVDDFRAERFVQFVEGGLWRRRFGEA